MKKKFLILLFPAFLLTGWTASSRADSTREYDFSKQEAMADEALKHLGAHWQLNRCGGIGRTTPEVWDGRECTTWEKCHKKRNISCIGVRHFDCSGLMYFCANRAGFNIPRTETSGYGSPRVWYERYCTPVPLNRVRKGTLVFKKNVKSNNIFHVGIYLGNKTVVECTSLSGQKPNEFPGVRCTQWSDWLIKRGRYHYGVLAGNLVPSRVDRRCDFSKQETMVDEALKHLGEHFDSSKFVYFCAKAVGFNSPCLSGYPTPQYWYDKCVTPVPLDKVRKGTLVFKGYGKHYEIKISHVGIYLGNGKVIECGGARSRVCITLWNAWLGEARRDYNGPPANRLLAGNLLYPPEGKIRARDAKRIQDLKQVQFALELYYKQTKSYPQGTFFSVWDTNYGHATNYWSGGKFPWSTALYDALVGNGYLDSLPLDPINSEAGDGNFLRDGPSTDRGYVYWSDNGQRYLAGTNLEEGSASPNNWGNYQIKGGSW